jgi:DNA recombination-dependent growth factor C
MRQAGLFTEETIMPVEVRELIIKTEIRTLPAKQSVSLDSHDIKALKQQIIGECLRIFKDRGRGQRDIFNR